MYTFFVELWTDPAKFKALMRGLAVLIAGAIQAGVIPLPASFGGWLGAAIPVLIAGGAVAFPAGQTNEVPHFEVKK